MQASYLLGLGPSRPGHHGRQHLHQPPVKQGRGGGAHFAGAQWAREAAPPCVPVQVSYSQHTQGHGQAVSWHSSAAPEPCGASNRTLADGHKRAERQRRLHLNNQSNLLNPSTYQHQPFFFPLFSPFVSPFFHLFFSSFFGSVLQLFIVRPFDVSTFRSFGLLTFSPFGLFDFLTC